jgi:hypothetical protein
MVVEAWSCRVDGVLRPGHIFNRHIPNKCIVARRPQRYRGPHARLLTKSVTFEADLQLSHSRLPVLHPATRVRLPSGNVRPGSPRRSAERRFISCCPLVAATSTTTRARWQ